MQDVLLQVRVQLATHLLCPFVYRAMTCELPYFLLIDQHTSFKDQPLLLVNEHRLQPLVEPHMEPTMPEIAHFLQHCDPSLLFQAWLYQCLPSLYPVGSSINIRHMADPAVIEAGRRIRLMADDASVPGPL